MKCAKTPADSSSADTPNTPPNTPNTSAVTGKTTDAVPATTAVGTGRKRSGGRRRAEPAMEETNSEESLYNLLLADCRKAASHQRRETTECKRTRMKCTCRPATAKTGRGGDKEGQRELTIQCEPLPSLPDVSVPSKRRRKQSLHGDDKTCHELPSACRKDVAAGAACNAGRTGDSSNGDDCDRSHPVAGRRSCRKCCCGGGRPPSSQLACCVDTAGQWLGAVRHWMWDKKWHFFVAATAFILGMYFDDYCQCYANDECSRYA